LKLALSLLPETLAIAHLPVGTTLPSWLADWLSWDDSVVSVSRTQDEISVICRSDRVPADVEAEHGWRVFKVAGPLSLSLTGVLMRLLSPLAEAGVPILALSTFDTDYVLVRDGRVPEATTALRRVAEVAS
jgi:hypothetical protein